MLAIGQELLESCLGMRDGVRAGDADGIEAEAVGLRYERRLQIFRVQKSRSA
ncbi:MAG: hypothetical protein JWN71_2130 [Xanthobacteraceae bacterium]|nr:hypothetical protein [Xanthobacteraceae bacterium]